jgi:hypothetical protein
MHAELDPLIQEQYARIAALLDAALLRLARNEAEAVETLVNDVTGQETIEEQPTDRQVRAGVVHGIFPSASKPTDLATFASDWWTRAAASVSQRIGDSLTTGIALEENLVELTRRIRGTSEQAFTDGIMAKARSDATRLLTTQMTNALGEARSAVAAVNASRIILSHVSLRDGHTSLICIARDGKRFTATPDHAPIGHDLPYLQGVPYHPN